MEEYICSPAKRVKTETDSFDNYTSTDTDKVITGNNQEVDSKSNQSENCNVTNQTIKSIPEQFLQIELKYDKQFTCLTFEDPISYVYSPIQYAFNLHSQFVHKFCQSEKEILFLGMNPGPWGMSQTGVPFGEISEVRDWLGITGEVQKPKLENPFRPIQGLSCLRSEPSGKKFWGVLKAVFGRDPYVCLKNCYVHNYCPLAFMTDTGRNITLPEIRASKRQELLRICDELLVEVLLLLNVKTVIAVGKFAEGQAKSIIKRARLDSVKLLCIPHPSPRNPGGRKTWEEETNKTLKKLLSQ